MIPAAATYERARRLANVAAWSVAFQCRRLRFADPEDADFVFRRWTDFDFLVVSLTRLRRAARLASGIPEMKSKLTGALREFDAALPGLKNMRDIAEHIDDYAVDRGKRSKNGVSRKSLEVSTLRDEGPTLDWLGERLDARVALHASTQLFDAVKGCAPLVSRLGAD